MKSRMRGEVGPLRKSCSRVGEAYRPSSLIIARDLQASLDPSLGLHGNIRALSEAPRQCSRDLQGRPLSITRFGYMTNRSWHKVRGRKLLSIGRSSETPIQQVRDERYRNVD